MKIMRLLVLFLAIGSLALPITSQACGKYRHGCYTGCKSGLIYNENDGLYYPVPTSGSRMVYRSEDGRLIPVGKYGCGHCTRHKCYDRVVSVRCQDRPGYWWMTTWMAPSKECWYVVR